MYKSITQASLKLALVASQWVGESPDIPRQDLRPDAREASLIPLFDICHFTQGTIAFVNWPHQGRGRLTTYSFNLVGRISLSDAGGFNLTKAENRDGFFRRA